MTEFETTSLIVAGAGVAASIIGAFAASIAAAGIWYGIRAMVRANGERAVILDQQREADERRHTQAMAALNELICAGQRQGEALERQGIALERQGIALERQGIALERQTAALDELLRRPAPAG